MVWKGEVYKAGELSKLKGSLSRGDSGEESLASIIPQVLGLGPSRILLLAKLLLLHNLKSFVPSFFELPNTFFKRHCNLLLNE